MSKILSVLLGIVVLGSMLVAMNKDFRLQLRGLFFTADRIVLSALTAQLSDTPIRIVKVKTNENIVVEFYNISPNTLIQRLELADRRDAFMSISGKITNLAVDDIDGDETLELIVPTFDENMISNMNVIKYDPIAKVYKLVSLDPSL